MRPLTRSDGTPTQAVYGFTNMLLKLRRQIEKSNKDTPEEHYMAVILDAGSKSFRNEIYDQYKANRPPAPEDLIPQFPLIREASEALNIATVEKAGYEADDIIATYVREAKENGVKVTIVSSDKDLMQLVDDNVHMFDAMKDKDIGPAQVEEKFGVAPSQVLDLLALMGDSADNIPGVPGIGPKTAAELLLAYGSLEGIFEHTSEITQKKRRETLEENVEQAKLSRELADLCYEVPDIAHFDAFDLRAIDGDKLHAFLSQNEFKALIARVEKEFGVVPEHITAPDRATPAAAPTNTHYTTLKDTKALLAFAEKAKQTGTLSLLPCYDHSGIIFGYSLATQAGSAAFIAAHTAAPQKGQQSLFGDEEESTEAQESDVCLWVCFGWMWMYGACPVFSECSNNAQRKKKGT
jgi:DNA polymerase-1